MSWGILLGLLGVVLGNVYIGLAAAVLLGICTCVQLILLVGLVPQIANIKDAAPLAAGMFTVSYLIAIFLSHRSNHIHIAVTGSGSSMEG